MFAALPDSFAFIKTVCNSITHVEADVDLRDQTMSIINLSYALHMYDHIMLQAYYLAIKPETLNNLSYNRGETRCSCHVRKGQLIIRCLNVFDNFFNLSHTSPLF